MNKNIYRDSISDKIDVRSKENGRLAINVMDFSINKITSIEIDRYDLEALINIFGRINSELKIPLPKEDGE